MSYCRLRCFSDCCDFSDVCYFLENRGERLSALSVCQKHALFSKCKMGGTLISRFWLCTNYVKHIQTTTVFHIAQTACFCELYMFCEICDFVCDCLRCMWFSGISYCQIVILCLFASCCGFGDLCDCCDFPENRGERLSALSVFKQNLFSKYKMGENMAIQVFTLYNLRKTYVKH